MLAKSSEEQHFSLETREVRFQYGPTQVLAKRCKVRISHYTTHKPASIYLMWRGLQHSVRTPRVDISSSGKVAEHYKARIVILIRT